MENKTEVVSNENKKKKKRRKLTDEDYMAMSKYDFDLFTVDDFRHYKEILLSKPYDWKLMRFFHGEYLEENKARDRIRNAKVAIVSFDDVENYVNEGDEPLTNMINKSDLENVWQEITGQISDATIDRVIDHYVGHVSQKKIARREGKNVRSVRRAIARAVPKITSAAEKLLAQGEIPGFLKITEKEEDE